MGKTWTTRRRGDEKDFLRWLAKGKTVFTINSPQHAGDARIWNHAQTWSQHTVTGKHPILGTWFFDGSPSKGAKSLFQWAGTVYETPPRGIPFDGAEGPRVASPLPCGDEYDRPFDLDEIGHMEKRAREAADQYDEDRKAGRRGGKWF